MTTPSAPQWTAPGVAGSLSNKRGNSGSDTITVTARYRNPRATSDPIANLVLRATKPVALGAPQAMPQVVQNNLIGTPAVSQLPVGMQLAQRCVFSNGRIFVTDGKAIYSAALPNTDLGALSVGAWRSDGQPAAGDTNASIGSMVVVGNYLYAMWSYQPLILPAVPYGLQRTQQMGWAIVNADGSLGAWAFSAVRTGGTIGSVLAGGIFKTAAGVPAAILVGVGMAPTEGFASSGTWWAGLNPDGSPTWAAGSSLTTLASTGTAMPTASTVNHAVLYDAVFDTLYMVGGQNGGTLMTNVSYMTTVSTNKLAGAWQAGTALPVATAGGGLSLDSSGNWQFSGGSPAGGPTATVYKNAGLQGGTWFTDTSLNETRNQPAVLHPSTLTPTARIVLGGISGSTLPLVEVDTGSGTWFGSPGTALTQAAVAAVFAGSTLVTNADGSIDVTIPWFGGTQADGDQLQFAIQFVDNVGGDTSPIAYASVKIGQAPTVTGLAGSPASSGKPTFTWNFNAGAGGALQLQWQLTVKNGATLMFDSGIVQGNADSVLAAIAPLLASGTAYTVVAKAWSADTALTGSDVVTGTQTIAWTPNYAAPAVPTSSTATPNSATGSLTVQWTNPGGSTAAFNRIFYRRTGASTWNLLMDGIVAVIGSAQNVVIWDGLAWNVAYDFAVSAVLAANAGESALTAGVSAAAIAPTAFSSMLHVAGNGAAYNAQLIVPTTPKIKAHRQRKQILPFNALRPLVRYGPAHWEEMEITDWAQSTAALNTLLAVLNQAQLGNPLVYRDALGTLMTVGLHEDSEVTYVPIAGRMDALQLVSVPDTTVPTVAQGFAQGYQVQTYGNAPGLDNSEFAA
jgi:hypothetical protein